MHRVEQCGRRPESHFPLIRRACAIALAAGLLPSATYAQEIPASTIVHVRLQQPVSSFGSERDDRITTTVIAPVVHDGTTLVPLGARILGHVEGVRRVGLGFSRETAFVDMTFDTLQFDGSPDLPLDARVAALDNAREHVTAEGRITGIRATASFASMLSGAAISAGAMDPMLLPFTVASSLSLFRIPESEIILPAGTELRLRLTSPVSINRTFDADVAPPAVADAAALSALTTHLHDLPFRTATQVSGEPSDLTNLVIVGSKEAVEAAFTAAGWGSTDPLSAQSSYAALRAIVENQGYREAPMSVLVLDGRPPTFTYAKTLNTFFQRHHLRVFGPFGRMDGQDVWTSSSTHDSGIGFATRSKGFIHVIDQHIDEERDKVVYDLVLTGCVTGVTLVDRPWVPRDASNATGDALITDGRAAVIVLDECRTPRRADALAPAAPDVRPKPSGPERFTRDVTLWVKNDLFRGNIVYQGYSGVKMAVHALERPKTPPEGERTVTYGGETFQVVAGPDAAAHPRAPSNPGQEHRPSFHTVTTRRTIPASKLEFSGSVGGGRFGNDDFSTQGLTISAGSEAFDLAAVTSLNPKNGFSVRTTLNSTSHLTHEVSYTFNRTSFDVAMNLEGESPSTATAPAQIRQFNYNLLANFTPNGSRVRPFVAVGPGLQLIRLSDAVESTNRLLRFAFRDVGLIEGAWDFGRSPPLEGGGIFQVALQYGAGVRIYATPRFFLRMDVRETLSKQPDFWTDSYPSLRDEGIEPGRLDKAGPLRYQLWSAGIGIAF